jgi:phage baseplate assembly protein W
MSFKFKSSGIKKTDINVNSSNSTKVTLYGLKFPFEFDDKYTFLKCNTNSLDQISDDLTLLIMTNYGERLGIYNYGANLKELLTESLTVSEFNEQAAEKILNAVSLWMPFVSLIDLKTEINQNSKYATQVFNIKIDFSVPQISDELRTINFTVNLF